VGRFSAAVWMHWRLKLITRCTSRTSSSVKWSVGSTSSISLFLSCKYQACVTEHIEPFKSLEVVPIIAKKIFCSCSIIATSKTARAGWNYYCELTVIIFQTTDLIKCKHKWHSNGIITEVGKGSYPLGEVHFVQRHRLINVSSTTYDLQT
jgi:hypothetical protein